MRALIQNNYMHDLVRSSKTLSRRLLSLVALSASALLVACGGGGIVLDGEVVVEQPIIVVEPAAFSIVLRVNGQSIPNVNLLPGLEQDVDIPVGNNFELTASGPVEWTVVAGSEIVVAPVGTVILYAGASISPVVINNARYAANTSATSNMPFPAVVSLIATSLVDRRQEAQINIVLVK
jgi:hypothetical protein